MEKARVNLFIPSSLHPMPSWKFLLPPIYISDPGTELGVAKKL